MSYNLGKPFESLFSNALCLPGCFAMYRIYAKNKHNSKLRVPILIDEYVFTNYFNEDGDTLHQKNLLLGEDRYLTTLIVRTFPKRKLGYCTQATCSTAVPDAFSVLLSQRRRWINGTIHNQLELLFTSGLPGRFCFSVQFLTFLEIFIVCTLPFSMLYFIAFLIQVIFTESPNILVLIASLAIYMLNGAITLTNLKVFKWYLVYLISVPIWNIVLPLYSFWYFDGKYSFNLSLFNFNFILF
jgi:chitin synthase